MSWAEREADDADARAEALEQLTAERDNLVLERDEAQHIAAQLTVALAEAQRVPGEIARRADLFKQFQLEGGNVGAAEVWDSAAKLAREYAQNATPLEWTADHTPPPPVKPTIVVLCGSTRFSNAFREANLRETLAGRIVLSIGCDMRTDAELFADFPGHALAEVKARLDELHKRKIDTADEVLVLNVGGYVGDSTRSEVAYAERLGKPVRWLEPADGKPDLVGPAVFDVAKASRGEDPWSTARPGR